MWSDKWADIHIVDCHEQTHQVMLPLAAMLRLVWLSLFFLAIKYDEVYFFY